MKKYLAVIIFFIIYTASVAGSWYATNWNYTNRWKTFNPSAVELFFVFVPVLNTVFSIYFLINSVNTNNFFNIEKENKCFILI